MRTKWYSLSYGGVLTPHSTRRAAVTECYANGGYTLGETPEQWEIHTGTWYAGGMWILCHEDDLEAQRVWITAILDSLGLLDTAPEG